MNNCAATPVPFPDCSFCGAAGVQAMMRKWCAVQRTVFLHPECEAVLRKRGVIKETLCGEQRMNVQELYDASREFYAERGRAPLNATKEAGQ